MPHRFGKKHSPFITLPRHKRSNEVIHLKGRIKRDSGVYGGMFTSRLVLDEPGRPDLYNQWFDFYFPGRDRFTLWNAEIVTARKAFWDAAHELAHQRTVSMLTPEEHAAESNMEFEPADISSTGKVLSYKLVQREKMRHEKFGGLTFFDQWEKLEAEIVREEPPAVYESFRLDRGYAYGIGLHIVLDVEVIDRAAIEQAITEFGELGETDWQAANPVPRSRLPVVSEKAALAAI
jgi:hypothetical protein